MPEASPTEGEASFYRSTLSALKWFAPKRWREVSLDAQALTFSTLLALVPTLTLLLWAFQHLGGFLHLRYNLEAELLELFSATPEVREVFGGLLEQTTQYLERGALGPVALIVFGYSFISMMMLLDNRLNRAFGINEAPPSGLRVLSYAAVLLLGPIPLILVLGILAFVLSSPLLAEIVNINLSWLIEIGSPIVVATFALTLLYKWVPQTPIQWSAAFRGALFAAIVWNLAKLAFAYYAYQAWTLKDLYGSLVTIPLFILWLYASWIVTLLGARLARRLNRFETIDDEAPTLSAAMINWAQLRVSFEAYRAEQNKRAAQPLEICEDLELPALMVESTLSGLLEKRLIKFDDQGLPHWAVELGSIDPRIFLQAVALPGADGWDFQRNSDLERWLSAQFQEQPANLAALSDLIAPLH